MWKLLEGVDSDKLIDLVKSYPELYDQKHEEYGNQLRKEQTWKKIADELDISVELARAKWNSLRSSFRRVLRECNDDLSAPTVNRQKWRYENKLSFLKDSVLERRRTFQIAYTTQKGQNGPPTLILTNQEEPPSIKQEELDVDEHFTDEDDFRTFTPFSDSEFQKSQPVEAPKRKRQRLSSSDDVSLFFIALAATVKNLPPLSQAQVKAEVFKIVNAAEVEFLQKNVEVGKTAEDEKL